MRRSKAIAAVFLAGALILLPNFSEAITLRNWGEIAELIDYVISGECGINAHCELSIAEAAYITGSILGFQIFYYAGSVLSVLVLAERGNWLQKALGWVTFIGLVSMVVSTLGMFSRHGFPTIGDFVEAGFVGLTAITAVLWGLLAGGGLSLVGIRGERI